MGLNSLAQFHDGLAARDVGHAAANQIALFMLGDVLVDAGGLELLQTEANAPLFAVDFQHHGAYRLAGLEDFLRMVDAFLRADVADVNHAFNSLIKLYKRTELGQTRNRTFDDAAN